MVAVHNELSTLPALEILDVAGKVTQRKEDGVGKGHEGVLVGFPNVQKAEGLSAGQPGGNLARLHHGRDLSGIRRGVVHGQAFSAAR